MSSPRRALVTGISGQTGSYLAEQLLKDNWNVHGLIRTPVSEVQPEKTTSSDVGLVLHQGNLDDPDGLARLVDEVEPDVIFHLGALTQVGPSWDQPVEYIKTIGGSTGALLLAAANFRKRTGREISFVNASSSEVFGDPSERSQSETTLMRPLSPYGAAKAYGHLLSRVYRAQGVITSNCILFNHESPRRPKTFVTRKITSGVADIAAGRADSLTLGNIQARRDWGWAPDYAKALILSAGHNDDFVIATGQAHSVTEFIQAAFISVGINNWSDYIKEDARFMRPSDAPEMVGNPTKAKKVLGWESTVSFEELVARMVAADLNND